MGRERFPLRIVRFLEHGSLSEPAGCRPIAFVHINKTAGTTFTEYLRNHFLAPSAVAPPFFGDYEQIGIKDSTRELYWGHFPFAQFAAQRPDAIFITFLRDPVERVISQYRSLHNPANLSGGWAKVISAPARRALEFAQQATFEEFAFSDEPFIVGHLQDLQTRFLSSFADVSHPEFLSSAMANLERKLLFFGTTETFARSIQLFQYQLGSSHPYRPEQQRRNVSQPYPVEMNARTRSRVEQLVANDLQLYVHAARVLERRFQVLDQLESISPGSQAA
jgi:hypothetical protein